MKKTIGSIEIDDDTDVVSLEDLVKIALSNPRGDALLDELERMYVYRTSMNDEGEVNTHVMAFKEGQRDIVLRLRQILEDASNE